MTERRKRFNRQEADGGRQICGRILSASSSDIRPCQTTEKGHNYRIIKHRKLFKKRKEKKRNKRLLLLLPKKISLYYIDTHVPRAPQSSSSTPYSEFSQSFAIHDRSRRLRDLHGVTN